MLIDLIAAVAAAFAGGGMVLALRTITRGRVPGWLIPAVAGASMIGYTMWTEYTWYERTVAGLPESVEVLSAPESQSVWRPWTYISPLRSRFLALDTANVRRNPDLPGLHLAEIAVFARHSPSVAVPVLVDCKTGRRADLTDGAEFAEDGSVANADWRAMAGDEPLARFLCGQG